MQARGSTSGRMILGWTEGFPETDVEEVGKRCVWEYLGQLRAERGVAESRGREHFQIRGRRAKGV